MRTKHTLMPALLIFFLLSCSFNSSLADKIELDPYSWDFIDISSGAPAFISKKESKMVIAEFGELAKFCDDKDMFYCFSSKGFHFSIPRDFDTSKQDEWYNLGYIYCMIETFEKNEITNYLIYSRKGNNCSDPGGFDWSAIYSAKFGLQYIYYAGGKEASASQLYSTSLFGFPKPNH